ncbi:hypothetical protein THARTR1_06394 [Trichoderma harzianum]|uniref:Uncharacterized protein n=1 Tax=Trichoderma harzianum TaxID=5544 RepID=A0A2K0U612_TRIHA|nr:hypothetical protein THARTR1_06394 [Trichoderma harzianum]
MDVDTPSEQAVIAAASRETKKAMLEKRQELMQRRDELRNLVDSLPGGFQEVSGDVASFGHQLESDVLEIEDEHQPFENRYNSALGAFEHRWNNYNDRFGTKHHLPDSQPPVMERVAKLSKPVEAFSAELKSIQEAFKEEINHPEVSFKKDLNSLRERLEERKETCYYIQRKFDEAVERLENVCKRVDELEKLAEQ